MRWKGNHCDPVLLTAGTTRDPASSEDSGTTFKVSSHLWKRNRFYWSLGRQTTALALKTPVLRVTVRSSKEMLSETLSRVAVLIRKGKSEKREEASVRREGELTAGWTA